MNSRLEETQSKWTCEYCTYENWPSSLKCTMCRGTKPLLGEDIYRLRDPSPQRSSSNVASGPVPHISNSTDSYNLSPQNYSQNLPSGGKWSCESCTYLNYPNATRCVQCDNRRTPNNTTQSSNSIASNLHEHLAPLRLGDPPPPSSLLTNTVSNDQLNPASLNNVQTPPPPPPPNVHPDKWSCIVCTYENWPKATKCVMCGHPTKERGERREKSGVNSGLILPSPERDHNRGLPLSPQSALPYIHQAQRDENLAIARRFVSSLFQFFPRHERRFFFYFFSRSSDVYCC